jgi:hypothetical protein
MHGFRRTTLTALALGLVFGAPITAPALARTRHVAERGASARPHARPPRSRPSAPAATDALVARDAWIDAPDVAMDSPEPPVDLAEARGATGVEDQMAGWISATGDNQGMAFAIVDKLAAKVFVYDADGSPLGSAPVLVGLARGDDSAPGIGDLKLAQIDTDERTTPAGRFVAQFGPSKGHGDVLWVDFADSISMHPVMSVNANEHRQQRIRSASPEAHRISYGCINVPKAFYDGVVLPALAGGSAIVYVLPDTKPLDAVFPVFAAALSGKGEPGQQVSIEDPLFTPVPDQP